MFKNKVTPAPVLVKAKELKRSDECDNLKLYEQAQELANEHADNEFTTINLKCTCCKVM